MQLRHCEIVTNVDMLKVDLQETFMKYSTIKKWAYIVHDKDDTRAHYHIYLNFGKSSADTKLIAKWFQLGYTDKDGKEQTGEQFISKIKGRGADVLLYLTHENESQKYKHIYDRSEVHANFDFESEIATAKIIGDFEHYSYAQMLAYVDTLPIDEKTSVFTKLRKLWELHCQNLALKHNRKIDVIFICGKSGTGKTYYAKKLCEKLGYDYCITSSENDPLQDYMGQNVLICDDFRDTVMTFVELLKFLDNDTLTSARSRYSNKVFNGKLIIITSSVPLRYWYWDIRSDSREDVTQLYRRIGCYVVMSSESYDVYHEISGKGEPTGEFKTYKNELSDLKKSAKTKTNFFDLFGKVSDEICFDDLKGEPSQTVIREAFAKK